MRSRQDLGTMTQSNDNVLFELDDSKKYYLGLKLSDCLILCIVSTWREEARSIETSQVAA